MKTVLITGGAGFIAHHVVSYLLDTTDWKIICLDRLKELGWVPAEKMSTRLTKVVHWFLSHPEWLRV